MKTIFERGLGNGFVVNRDQERSFKAFLILDCHQWAWQHWLMKSHILSPVACIDTLTVPVPTWKAWSNWMTHSRTHGATLVLWIGLTQNPRFRFFKGAIYDKSDQRGKYGQLMAERFSFPGTRVWGNSSWTFITHASVGSKIKSIVFYIYFFRWFNTLEAFFCQTKHLWMSRLLCGLRSMVAELKCTKVSDFQNLFTYFPA